MNTSVQFESSKLYEVEYITETAKHCERSKAYAVGINEKKADNVKNNNNNNRLYVCENKTSNFELVFSVSFFDSKKFRGVDGDASFAS